MKVHVEPSVKNIAITTCCVLALLGAFRTGLFCAGEPARRGVGEVTSDAGGGSAKACLDDKPQSTRAANRAMRARGKKLSRSRAV